jgi:hypothetical protein
MTRLPPTDLEALQALLGPWASPCRRALTGETGISLPPLTDHHVHLHLVDETPLAEHGIAAVMDLGGDPVALARRAAGALPHVSYAGPFLTAPDGYPSGRSWAPPGIVRLVTSASAAAGAPGGATAAVDEAAVFGASVIKVALNADAGPVLDDGVLAAIVAAAHARGLAVVAHAEGGGMVDRALRAGVDVLAHTPFTETLTSEAISAAAASQRWISTLDIHRDDPDARRRAIDNLARFAAAGGDVLYGTDLGNGDLPVGVNTAELAALDEAGLSGARLVATLVDPWPKAHASTAVATFVPGPPPAESDEIPRWLGDARVVPAEELVHDVA